MREAGLNVEMVVRHGTPHEEILACTDDVDMIVVATHGRSGIARWWLGSTADHVIKEVGLPRPGDRAQRRH